MAHSRDLARGAPWLQVDPRELWSTYTIPLVALMPVVLAFGVSLLLRRSIAGRARPEAERRHPGSELALILGLLLLPVLAFVLGIVVTKAYSFRYVSPYLAGVGLMLAYVGGDLFRGRTAVGLVLAGVMLACFLKPAKAALASPGDWAWRGEVEACASRAAAAGKRLAITNWGDYALYRFHCDPTTAGRLVLADFGGEHHRRMFDSLGRWLSRKGLGAFDVVDGRDFFANPDRY